MAFQISAMSGAPFQHFFEMTDEALAAHGARRVVADSHPGFPCRVSLEDAQVGETLILCNHTHLDALSPYAASHAIYVRQDATEAKPAVGDIPPVLTSRILSVRAFDADGYMIEADVTQGRELAPLLDRLLDRADVAFVDIHNAKQGCFAARAHRV